MRSRKPLMQPLSESISSDFLRFALPAIRRQLRLLVFRRNLAVFGAQLRLEGCELSLNILLGLALADDLLAITAQEIVDGFDADPDGAGRLVLVQILETEVRRAGLLDDAFDHAINRRVVPTLEAGDFQSHKIGMARCELGGPNFVVGAA